MSRFAAFAPPGVPPDLIDEGQNFAVDMLERYGELLPVAFTSSGGGRQGVFSAYHDQPIEGQELLGLLYSGLKSSAGKNEIDTAVVFTEGNIGDSDALVCFAEHAAGGCALLAAPFTFAARPLRALGMQIRRGKAVLESPQIKPAQKRIFVS